MKKSRLNIAWLPIVLLIAMLSLLCSIWFVKKIMLESALSWAFQQSTYWKCIAELFVLAFSLFMALFLPKKNGSRVLCVCVAVLVFAYLHAFFYAFIVGVLYAAMIWMTGMLVRRLILGENHTDFLSNILLGMSAIIIITAICSVLKFGTPEKLRIAMFILFAMEVFYFRAAIAEKFRLLISGEPVERTSQKAVESLLLAAIFTGFLIQVGRANIALDYDSIWYGLRSNQILAPYTGIYDKLMTTGCVYNYAKGIETLSLAFSFETTYSFVYAVNLMFAAILLYVVYRCARLFSKKNTAMFAVLCCAVTPGIMNMASTAKSDISTLLLQMMTLYFAAKALKVKSKDQFVLACSAALLSVVFKPSSIVFSIILLVVAVVILYKNPVRDGKWHVWLIMPSLLAVILLWARTYLLTGVPLTYFLSGLWENLGCSYQFPYSGTTGYSTMLSISELLVPGTFLNRLKFLAAFFFLPVTGDLDHVIIAWPGLLFAVTWLVIVLKVFLMPKKTWKRMKDDPAYALSVTGLALISIASMGCIMLLQKPDGNYFMLMYAMTFTHAAVELDVCPRQFVRSCRNAAIPLLLCGYLMCMGSHWSWALGFTPISLQNGGAYNHAAENQAYYEAIGIDQICTKLAEEKELPRVMVFSGDIPKILTIPGVVDSYLDLEHWGNYSISQSAEQLYRYYCLAEMDYLLIDMEYLDRYDLPKTLLSTLAETGNIQIEMDQGTHYLLRFVESGAEADADLCSLLAQE